MTLTGAETGPLLLLWKHAGMLLSREMIIALFYDPPGTVEKRTIDLLVNRLRRKLARGGEQPEMLRTIRGDLGLTCLYQPVAVARTVNNLIDNACKFGSQEGCPKNVPAP
ncbi:helix-turn-helix domain-containing protein [Komagataeibacter swingsii]|nr:helix-turn-helix domain-containing protein [Komagataeibacter swingsii]